MTLYVSRAGRMAMTLALSFALLPLFEGVAKCQSPSVNLANLTTGNNQVFNVGDYFQLVVFGPCTKRSRHRRARTATVATPTWVRSTLPEISC
jgi:hypothetical protein